MTADDVDAAAALLDEGGWGRATERAALFRVAVELPSMEPIVAIEGERLVGTALASAHGPVGWVGVVFVADHARGRGIGSCLTEAALDALRRAGCSTVQLVATPEGRRIYERLGFELETTYRLLTASGGAPPGPGAGADARAQESAPAVRLRPLERDDLAAVAAIDAEATGEDRAALLTAVIGRGPGTAALDANGRLRGWAMRAPWGGWPTIALDPEAGLALLAHRRTTTSRDRPVVAGLPIDNGAGIEALLATGWTDRGEVPRLVRGPRRRWRPATIWGQFSFAVG